ncbi:MAG: ABC transporter substrate-binding protein [Nitrospirae bacterium]|nr:ABC transporter substrate-binding protein [Nitrospirota bacterium]
MELTYSAATKKPGKIWLLNFAVSILLLNYILSASPASAEIPGRIISLAPNITEILFAIGLDNRIVGVTNFCDYPEEAKRKPKVGGMSTPSLEAVVSLKPCIVVMTTDGNPKEFEQRLRSLKIKTYIFRARTLTELPQGVRDMGLELGAKEKADTLARKIETAINNPPTPPFTKGGRGGITEASQKKRVLFIIWPEPLIVAGPGTVIDDAISILGLENAAYRSKVSYPKYSIEEIIRQSPDIIFIGKGHENIKEVSKRLLKKIATVPAVKKGNVFYLSDTLYRLGPRVINGIEEMAGCLK